MSLIVRDNETDIAVGMKSPDFILKDENGADWQLSKKRGHVIALLFYPADETLVCTKQLCSVRDSWDEYMKTGAEIVGISPGSVESHKSFADKHRLPLTLLADMNNEVTKKFSQHWWMPSWLTRALVVIDAEGVIRYRKVMLRAFRPSDKSTLAAIYLARYDNLAAKVKSNRAESIFSGTSQTIRASKESAKDDSTDGAASR